MFTFRGRRGDRIKLLFRDGQGFCLYYKVLEKGGFPLAIGHGWNRTVDVGNWRCAVRDISGCEAILLAWLKRRGGTVDDYAFPSLIDPAGHLSTRQDARFVDEWVTAIGLRPQDYGTHSLRRTKAAMIYRRLAPSDPNPAWPHQVQNTVRYNLASTSRMPWNWRNIPRFDSERLRATWGRTSPPNQQCCRAATRAPAQRQLR